MHGKPLLEFQPVPFGGRGRVVDEEIEVRKSVIGIAALASNDAREFVDSYNAEWLVEKNGFLSPAQTRQAWDDAMSPKAAA